MAGFSWLYSDSAGSAEEFGPGGGVVASAQALLFFEQFGVHHLFIVRGVDSGEGLVDGCRGKMFGVEHLSDFGFSPLLEADFIVYKGFGIPGIVDIAVLDEVGEGGKAIGFG